MNISNKRQRPQSSGKNKSQKPPSKDPRQKRHEQFFPSKLTLPPDSFIKQNFFIPQSLLKKGSESSVLFNVSGTRNKIIKEIGQTVLSWNLSTDLEDEWDIAWFDSYQDFHQFDQLKPYQKINFFPGIACLARKDHHSRNLARLQKRYPKEYDFFPETFVMPMDYDNFKMQFETLGKTDTYIVKPQASSQGKGIFLTQTWKSVPNSHRFIAQRYISNPYLLDNLKFDMRIYVLCTSCDPLKIYLFKDGLARFATEKYHGVDPKNLTNMYVHLTNYAINKNHSNFVFNSSEDEENVGHKRSLTALFKILENRGHNVKELWENIKQIVVKTFCTAQWTLSQKSKYTFPKNHGPNPSFQIFGFDIMIDENVKPWLLEVNSSPSLSADTPLDRKMKEKVIGDAFRIVNVTAEGRINYKLEQKAEELKNRLEKIYQFSKREDGFTFENSKSSGLNEAEIMKNNGYELIFPLKEDTKLTETYVTYMKEIKVPRPEPMIKKEIETKKQLIEEPLVQSRDNKQQSAALVKRPRSSYTRAEGPKNRPPEIEAITAPRSTRARNSLVGKSVNFSQFSPRKQPEVSRSLALNSNLIQKKVEEPVVVLDDARRASMPLKYEMPQKVMLNSPVNSLGLPKILLKEKTNSTEENSEEVAYKISQSTRNRPTAMKKNVNPSGSSANSDQKKVNKIVIKKIYKNIREDKSLLNSQRASNTERISPVNKSLSRSPHRILRHNSSKDLIENTGRTQDITTEVMNEVRSYLLQGQSQGHNKNSHSTQAKKVGEDISIISYRESVSLDAPILFEGEDKKQAIDAYQPSDDANVRILTDASPIKTTEGDMQGSVPKRFAQFLSGIDSENRKGGSKNFHVTNQGVFAKERISKSYKGKSTSPQRVSHERTITQEIQAAEAATKNFMMPGLMNLVKDTKRNRYHANNNSVQENSPANVSAVKGQRYRGQSLIVYTSEN